MHVKPRSGEALTSSGTRVTGSLINMREKVPASSHFRFPQPAYLPDDPDLSRSLLVIDHTSRTDLRLYYDGYRVRRVLPTSRRLNE